jgi:hypothetical protein
LEQEAENDEEAPASAPLATIHAEESTPPATENEEVLAASAVAEVPGGEARKFDAPDEDAKGAAASAGLKDVAEAGEDAPAATDSPAENASIGAPAGASGNVEAGSLELPSENKRTTGGGGSSSSGNRQTLSAHHRVPVRPGGCGIRPSNSTPAPFFIRVTRSPGASAAAEWARSIWQRIATSATSRAPSRR